MSTAPSRPGRERPPLLIIAVGNDSRGDDALGPRLLRELMQCEAPGLAAGEWEAIEDYQLQIEHALDLTGRRRALFIDAGSGTPAPFYFRRIEPGVNPGPGTHVLTPPALLAVYQRIERQSPPAAFVLCLRGERFDLGDDLSPAARHHLAAGLEFARGLLTDTRLAYWTSQLRD
jgi:hydrogenase maturation protease